MENRTQSAIVGGLSGALLGSIPGYLINKGPGAAVGAILGGVGLAVVGYATGSSSPAGLGSPRSMQRR